MPYGAASAGGLAVFFRLYARMRDAGFMHITAVSGVQYLIFGFFRITRKPVNWALFGT